MAAVGRNGWSEGFREGFSSGLQSGEGRIAQLEARVRELEQATTGRIDRITGDQVVEVGRYAYRWAGSPPLKIGDRVLLPKSWLSDLRGDTGLQEGVVTALESAYQGELKAIVRKIADAESPGIVVDPALGEHHCTD
ncbi:hypothetical protein VA596_38985 [Amycolatopsis sp., V23-08]|uniref:Uncharacterized protein n=1 Tax=Amycolatopsis heterodermiae TaxID=3110235 RepID=A0ABU5RH19_9PSEU|nr:hypothetical protein [Amycolatopsis sp., V23-08]MEA5365565.1 hypothetical protein [Amycolatopsis sp., V23-08]